MTQLTPLQVQALARAQYKNGFAYFLEMGLGKTFLTLAEFANLITDGRKVTRLAVICPNSFKGGWRAEVEKHGMGLAVHVYESSKHEAALRFIQTPLWTKPPVLIINYDAIRLPKVQSLLAAFTYRKNCMLALDESINLKNPTAKRTKAIHRMIPQFAYVRLLSGKPTTQGPHDLWGQLAAIGATRPGENFYAFRNRYCRMGGFENRQVKGALNADELQRRMAPFIYVAKKKDWLPSLPPKSYTARRYALSGVLSTEYARMERALLAYIRDKGGVAVDKVEATIALTKYGKLAQIMCGFIHDEDGDPQWLVEDKDNPRLQLLLELLEDEVEGKVCIVYRHKAVGAQLLQVLTQRNTHPAVLAGGMNPSAIAHEKDRFNLDPDCRVILLQVDAARYGHTLIGTPDDPCFTMLFYENSYSLDTRAQIEDRIHRIGQRESCLYVDFIGSEMDARITRALQSKQGLYRALFGD